jgi:[ribosomal protein S5]-alanine N-acetyltransferase
LEQFILFHSKNLEFREINPRTDNLENYLSWLRNPDSNPYIQGTDSDFDLETLIDYVESKNAAENCSLWGIYLRQDLRHIGNIKFEPIQPDNGIVWVGLLIGEMEFRGKGLGSEALSTAIRYFSEVTGIRIFYLGVDTRNLPAVKLYERQGFTFDKEKSLFYGKSVMSKILRA